MKKATLLLLIIPLVTFMLMSTAVPVYCADAMWGLEVGGAAVSFSYMRPSKVPKIYHGGGLSLWFVGENPPEYIPFENEPFDWWEYRKKYNKETGFGLHVKGGYQLTNNIIGEGGVGYTQIKVVDIWWSTATGWYWGKEKYKGYLSYMVSLNYKLDPKRYLSISYHYPFGLMGGIKWTF
ncbi:hypothetical protein IBX65_08020 [Candidatus Aerophobetes bacterium]|nr:hypothetical protein [Candidatus Aerophobetes bacterium]